MLIRVSVCIGILGSAATALAQHAPTHSLDNDIAQHRSSQVEDRFGTLAAIGSGREPGRTSARIARESAGHYRTHRASRSRAPSGERTPKWTDHLEVDDRLPNAVPKTSMMAIQTWAKISKMRDVRLFEAFHKSYGQVSPLLARLARERIAELIADEAELSAVVPPRLDSSERLNASDCKHVAVSVGTGVQRCVAPGSGSFKDCAFCPEMVVVPSGNFVMGSPRHEKGRRADEKQLHVTIRQPFAVGKFTVTREEFSVFAKATRFKPADPGCVEQVARTSVQTDRHPSVCVTWHEARDYVAWLSKTVGRPYRLMSEAEFEYAARAGTTTPYWWGHEVTPQQANYSVASGRKPDAGPKTLDRTVRVGSYKANAWGLFDVHGNVWEWTSDCISDDSQDNRGKKYGRGVANCRSARTGARVVRGGSWRNPAVMLRAASRRSAQPGRRSDSIGFRVARTLRTE